MVQYLRPMATIAAKVNPGAMQMSAVSNAGRQDRVAAWLGIVLFVSFIALFVNIVTLPRTPLDQRATLQMWHDTLGFVVLCLVLLRLLWWVRGPSPVAPAGLPATSFNFNRAILLALLLTFAAEALMGPFYAWSEGRDVGLFGIYLPRLIAPSESVRMSTGYLHSALGFYCVMLVTIWLFFGLYQHFRYRIGLRRLWPGAAV
jgi:cytochrome b561